MAKDELKKLPLHKTHLEHGAKMAEFAGYLMPMHYEVGILKEHQRVREHVGLFDISHMGELHITGADAKRFLQYIMTNDLDLLSNGKGQYSCICYENGTVVDDCIYYQYNEQDYRLIVNASTKSKDIDWLKSHLEGYNISIEDVSATRGRFALQGPDAEKVLDPLVEAKLIDLQRFNFTDTHLDDIPIFIARTGYTGEDGFELSFPIEGSQDVFDLIIDEGANCDITLVGLGARDTLRLEASYSLYGHELSNEITPLEASIGFVVKTSKEENYIGKDALTKQRKEGLKRKVVGVKLKQRGIMRENCEVYNEDGGKHIGYITSGTYSPTFKESIALALLSIDYTDIGTNLLIKVRNRTLKATVVRTPFYTYKGGK